MGYVNTASLLGMAVAFLNIATVLVICRVFIRRMQKLIQGLDDYFLYSALVLMIAMCINMITAVAYKRMGVSVAPRVLPDGTVDQEWGWSQSAAEHEKFEYAQEIIFPLQLACAKLSILFFYRRVLCPTTSGVFHWATLSVIVITTLWGVIYFFCFAFQCGNRFYLIWDGPMSINGEVCLGMSIEAGMSISDFILDVIILILPIRRIFTLQMPLGKKLLVAAAFALAGLTIFASFMRALVMRATLAGVSNDFVGSDEAMVNSTGLYWGLLESGMSVVVACLPSLQYLFVVAVPKKIVQKWGISNVAVEGENGSKRTANIGGSFKAGSISKPSIKVRRHDDFDSLTDSHGFEVDYEKPAKPFSMV